jgi:hypothetical protein
MAGKKFTRSEMLDLVWSAPLRVLAARLGLSDVGLKKAAQKAGVPTPPQGHWNRVAAGRKADSKPTLPPRGFGAPDDIWIGADRWRIGARPPGPSDSIPTAPIFEEPIEAVRRRAEKAVGRVTASKDFSMPHPVIRQILQDETLRAEKIRNSRWPSSWDAPRFSAPLDQRRLKLLNSICLGVARAGLKVQLGSKEAPMISVGSDAVQLPLIARKLLTNGSGAEADTKLSIVLGAGPGLRESVIAHWDDVKDRKLETKLTEIVVTLAVLLEQRYRDEQAQQHKWLLERREAAIEAAENARIDAERRERERIQKLEQERVERLLVDADKLRQAEAIRDFVAIGMMHFTAQAGSSETSTLEKWRAWALDQADRIDPIKNGRFLESLQDQS